VGLRLDQLAFNAIVHSEYLSEFDDAFAMIDTGKEKNSKSKTQFGQEFDTDLDEFVTCANSFAQLKKLLKCWVIDFD